MEEQVGCWERVYQCLGCEHIISKYWGFNQGHMYDPCPSCGDEYIQQTARKVYGVVKIEVHRRWWQVWRKPVEIVLKREFLRYELKQRTM